MNGLPANHPAPPRIWWDGTDFIVLVSPTYPCPGLYEAARDVDVPSAAVELVPAWPIDAATAGQVLASVTITTMPARQAPRWLRRLRCLTWGHDLIGAELPDMPGSSGTAWQVCRCCELPVHVR